MMRLILGSRWHVHLATATAGAIAALAAGHGQSGPLAIVHAKVIPAAHQASGHAHRVAAIGANQSNNWSGYDQGAVATGKTFHQVAGNWTVPTATQPKPGQAGYSATWVGIGGGCVDAACSTTDSTLIQAGTEQDVDSSGAASYTAWYEVIPLPSITASLPVRAGDQVHVDIHENIPNSELWSITIQNLTTGQSYGITLSYLSTYLTAEWIVETPIVVSSSGTSVGPLPKLGTVTFDLASTNGQPANLSASQELNLVGFGGNLVATPSAPDPDADGFNDCTYASSCPAPTGS
jgi:hypothetical protein